MRRRRGAPPPVPPPPEATHANDLSALIIDLPLPWLLFFASLLLNVVLIIKLYSSTTKRALKQRGDQHGEQRRRNRRLSIKERIESVTDEVAYMAATVIADRTALASQLSMHFAISELQEGDTGEHVHKVLRRRRQAIISDKAVAPPLESPQTPRTSALASRPWTPRKSAFGQSILVLPASIDEMPSTSLCSTSSSSCLPRRVSMLRQRPATDATGADKRGTMVAAHAAQAGLPATATPTLAPTLPAAARLFVGEWKHVRSDNYGAFLSECVGLNWATKKVAERIHPTPKFTITSSKIGERLENLNNAGGGVQLRGGEVLTCVTMCLGAKPVYEELYEGESHLYEPNLSIEYLITSRWEGDKFLSTRTLAADGTKGVPTTQARHIDKESGELVITQDWGGKKPFVARYKRA
jgi:hypothetical protein